MFEWISVLNILCAGSIMAITAAISFVYIMWMMKYLMGLEKLMYYFSFMFIGGYTFAICVFGLYISRKKVSQNILRLLFIFLGVDLFLTNVLMTTSTSASDCENTAEPFVSSLRKFFEQNAPNSTKIQDIQRYYYCCGFYGYQNLTEHWGSCCNKPYNKRCYLSVYGNACGVLLKKTFQRHMMAIGISSALLLMMEMAMILLSMFRYERLKED